jgi:antitoxin (DNA-binding transcriptional repressor) of toxin-antitoxin stability system
MKTLGISEFKAKCIDELKKVQETGEPLLVTLRKRPIATIHPYREEAPPRRTLGKLKGRIVIHGDIVHSDFADDWEMDR